jgi:WD40 repeat protein
MEEISEIDENLIYLSNLKIEDMFPENILYPDQDISLLTLNDKKKDNQGVFSNFKNSNLGQDKKAPKSKLQNNINSNLYSQNANASFKNSSQQANQKLFQINQTLDSFFSNKNSSELKNSESDIISKPIFQAVENKKDNSPEININEYEPEPTPLQYKFNKNSIKMLTFSQESKVYDILLRGDLIIACGGSCIKVYSLQSIIASSSKSKQTSCSTDPNIIFYDKDEDFYRISYTEIEMKDQIFQDCRYYLAAGGNKSIIRILDLHEKKEVTKLIGHRNEIYDLKFHPNRDLGFLLLSASKDFSIRLWNVISSTQICIFGGPEGHSADVLSVDWHLSGDYFVSSGIDNCIKIWKVDEKIKDNINKSTKIHSKEERRELKFKTIIRTRNIFSCNTIHENYIDCVQFNGNFIISKSLDGVVKEWLPQFNSEGDFYFLINSYIYPVQEMIWFIKFAVSAERNILVVPNEKGLLYLFQINENYQEDNITEDLDYFFTVKYVDAIDTEVRSIIRSVSFDNLSDYFVASNNSGEIFVGSFIAK